MRMPNIVGTARKNEKFRSIFAGLILCQSSDNMLQQTLKHPVFIAITLKQSEL